MHKHRILLALTIGGYASMLTGIGWGSFFFAHQLWFLGASDVMLAMVGLAVLVLTKQGHTRIAAYLLLASLLVLLSVMCLFVDIPTRAAPRSMHHFFLVLAALSFLIFQAERPWLKYGVPTLFIINFVFYASSQYGIVTHFVLSDNIRVVGTWVNNAVAMALTYTILYVMLSDLYVPKELEQDLRLAIQNNQLELYYQPQVDQHGAVWGAEALLRWKHPDLGLIGPSEFIPLAEETNLILPIGDWALKAVCAQLLAWAKNPAFANLRLSINVCAQQFHQSNFLNDTILTAQQVKAGRLRLELTESSLANDIDGMIKKMNALKTAGISIALDDFGTGYSSLHYLKRLPLDELKIDKSFVRDVLVDENDAAIVSTITTLGNSLGLKVVAEGVETVLQRNFLLENGCQSFQGYLFSPPLPIAAFEAFLINHQAKKTALQAA